MSSHYTAIIRVLHKAEKPEPTPGTARTVFDTARKSDQHERLREVVSLTIRADSIESLIEKATSHLALVEDTNG